MIAEVGPPGSRRDPWLVAGIALLLAGLGAVLFFDLASPLPLSDEWMFWFPLQSLRTGHGFQLWPGALPLSLVQLAVALPLIGASPEVWRVTELPFLVLAGGCAYSLGRRLGATRFWALMGAAAVTCAPVTLSVATGFTSDIAYLGLMMATAVLALRWLGGRGSLPILVAVAGLTTLQRQHGVVLVPALAVAIVSLGRRDRRHVIGLLAVGAAVLAALVAPFLLGITTSTMNGLRNNSGRLGPGPSSISATVVALMPMIGVFMMPMVPGLLRRPPGDARAGRFELLPLALCSAGLAGIAGFAFLFQGTIWPGNVLGVWGLGPTHVGGNKPPLLGLAPFLLIEALSVAAFLVVLGRRRRQWHPRNLGPEGVFLVVLGLAHLLPMPFTSPLDRYYIQVMAPMLPVVAAMASRAEAGSRDGQWSGPRAVRLATLVIIAAGIAFYGVGELDYQSWQAARERAAELAYTRLPPDRVEAGYEAVGVHVAVPEYLRSRRMVVDPIDLKPAKPLARLLFAGPGDPRPGADYRSLNPGRVVIVCVEAASACPFAPR